MGYRVAILVLRMILASVPLPLQLSVIYSQQFVQEKLINAYSSRKCGCKFDVTNKVGKNCSFIVGIVKCIPTPSNVWHKTVNLNHKLFNIH
jgi:hypothetical protein